MAGRRNIRENYEPPFDAAGYKPGNPKMKRIGGTGSGVVGNDKRQMKGSHGGTEHLSPKGKMRVNNDGVVISTETNTTHGEASDGVQDAVGHNWPDQPHNDGASGEFITGYDYTGAAHEPTLEAWDVGNIGHMIGEEINLQQIFNQYAKTRRSVNIAEFKNVCYANGLSYPMNESMFKSLLENNKEFIFTEHHDGLHRFYISESGPGNPIYDDGDEMPHPFDDHEQSMDHLGHSPQESNGVSEIDDSDNNPYELEKNDEYDNFVPEIDDTMHYDGEEKYGDVSHKPKMGGGWDGEESWGLGSGGSEGMDHEEGCHCNSGGPCICAEDCPDCKHAEGTCGGGKCGGGMGLGGPGTPLDPEDHPETGGNFREDPNPSPARQDFSRETPEAYKSLPTGSKLDQSQRPSMEGLERNLTRFFTEARHIIRENAKYGRRIIGTKLNESWDATAGYCRLGNLRKVNSALVALKNRYPSFSPLFENSQKILKTNSMYDKGEGHHGNEGDDTPSMDGYSEVAGKGLNNRKPKNGITGEKPSKAR
jgi:hypothetical protein